MSDCDGPLKNLSFQHMPLLKKVKFGYSWCSKCPPRSRTHDRSCCCCSKVLRRHMTHRPSTSFMSVLYNLAKWLFLYSVYFSSLFFSIFFLPFFHFFCPQAFFSLSHVYVFFAFFAALFFHQYIH